MLRQEQLVREQVATESANGAATSPSTSSGSSVAGTSPIAKQLRGGQEGSIEIRRRAPYCIAIPDGGQVKSVHVANAGRPNVGRGRERAADQAVDEERWATLVGGTAEWDGVRKHADPPFLAAQVVALVSCLPLSPSRPKQVARLPSSRATLLLCRPPPALPSPHTECADPCCFLCCLHLLPTKLAVLGLPMASCDREPSPRPMQ